MKVNIEIDLSPAEARELMGWPDMSKIHQAGVDAFVENLKNGNQDVMESMLKPYLASSQQAFGFYQKIMEAMAAKGNS